MENIKGARYSVVAPIPISDTELDRPQTKVCRAATTPRLQQVNKKLRGA